MLEEQGTVVHSDGRDIWVEAKARSSCSACSAGDCTTSVIGKLFGVKRNRLQLENSLHAQIGDQVVIGIPDALLVQASLRSYLLPLASMLFFVAIAMGFGLPDGGQSLMGLVGLALGFFLLGYLTHTQANASHFKPVLLRIAPKAQVHIDISTIRGLNHE